jgi:hypothetical protein
VFDVRGIHRAAHLILLGGTLELTGQRRHPIIQSCGKQQRLTIRRTQCQNPLHRLEEAHVGHAVCFINDGDAHTTQRHVAARQEMRNLMMAMGLEQVLSPLDVAA